MIINGIIFGIINMELSVIKIIDGILISDGSIANDYEFLLNNKISHAVGCSLDDPSCTSSRFEDIGIKLVTISVQKQQLPTPGNIQKCLQAIIESRDECLCCLIFSQNLDVALALLAPYFVCRYGWAVETSIAFIERRISLMNISNIESSLQNLRQQLPQILDKMLGGNKSRLKKIQWNRKFLSTYKTDDMEQQIVINTVKNALSTEQQVQDSQYFQTRLSNLSGKRRVTWHDLAAKNSVIAGQKLFANSRINNSLKKSSSLKNNEHRTSIKVPITELIQISKQRLPSAKKLGQSLKQNQFDDFDYLSLKELSRTNFDDMKFRGSGFLQKRRGFKGQKHSTINQVQNYRKKNTVKIAQQLNKPSKAINFIQGVKAIDNKTLRA